MIFLKELTKKSFIGQNKIKTFEISQNFSKIFILEVTHYASIKDFLETTTK